METLEKIANALDISYFELLDISETTKESNIQKITLNVEIKNIDEETKKAEKLIELLKEAKEKSSSKKTANNGKGISVGISNANDHYEYQVIRVYK